MIKALTIAVLIATPALAQTTAGGVVGGAPAPYTPAGAIPAPGTTPSGLGSATSPGSPMTPALPQPSTGVTPPIGSTTAGTIGDGRVGTLAPGAAMPGVTGQPGMQTTTGVSPTTPTTNPPPR